MFVLCDDDEWIAKYDKKMSKESRERKLCGNVEMRIYHEWDVLIENIKRQEGSWYTTHEYVNCEKKSERKEEGKENFKLVSSSN